MKQGDVALFLIIGCGVLLIGAGNQPKEKPQASQLSGFATPDKHPVTATLVAEHTAIRLGGEARVGVLFELEDGWHIYAKEPGDAGFPTTIIWSGSGVSFGALQWPTPQRFLDPGDIETFGYEERVLLSTDLRHTSPEGREPRGLPIHAQAKWLTCKEICIPGNADLELTLPIIPPNSSEALVPSVYAELFEPAAS